MGRCDVLLGGNEEIITGKEHVQKREKTEDYEEYVWYQFSLNDLVGDVGLSNEKVELNIKRKRTRETKSSFHISLWCIVTISEVIKQIDPQIEYQLAE